MNRCTARNYKEEIDVVGSGYTQTLWPRRKTKMTRTIFILLFVTTSTKLSGQILENFVFSDCLKQCIGDSTKIDSIECANDLTKIHFTAYAPCNGTLEGQINLSQDTLDLKYSTKPTIIVNKKTGKVAEILEIADCDCVFKFSYTIKGLRAISQSNIKINGETLENINKRNFSDELEIEIDTTKSSDESFIVVDKTAHFPGGFAKFYHDYIDRNAKYPEDAKSEGISGKVFVEFVINRDGSIDDTTVRVVQGLNGSCDTEAIRLMKECPDWIPGTMKDTPVKQKLIVPITFSPKVR
jgi:TonB family protein